MSDHKDDSDFLQGLTFSPGWAKSPSEQQRFDHHEGHGGEDSGSRDRRGRQEPFRGRDAGRTAWKEDNRKGGGLEPRRPRPPARSERFQDSPPMAARPFPVRSSAPGDEPPRATVRPRDGNEYPRRPFTPPPPVDYPVEVRFLPEPKALSVVIHKVVRGHRAFPIRDLARLFLDNPASCEVRIDSKPGSEGVTLHQCARCGWVSLSEGESRSHALSVHFPEDFTPEEVEGEAPSGVFVCVAKCGITGKLLAPPNHHSYNQRVQEVRRAECPHLTEDEYRGRIETIRDDAVIQQWREEARRRTVYRRKGAGSQDGEGLERTAAESCFVQEILPGLFTTPKHVTCSHAVAMQLNDPVLGPAVQDAWRRELRYPASLFFALRGAFRHKRLHVFRAGEGRGIDFVMSRVPTALDVQHAVPELKAIIDYLITNPGCTRAELLHAMGISVESSNTPEQERIVQQLSWITERGHVIEYHNGVLALPEEHPVFRTVPMPMHRTDRPAARRAPSEKPASVSMDRPADQVPVPREPEESPTAGPDAADGAVVGDGAEGAGAGVAGDQEFPDHAELPSEQPALRS